MTATQGQGIKVIVGNSHLVVPLTFFVNTSKNAWHFISVLQYEMG